MIQSNLTPENFTQPIIQWFFQYGRHHLPWQHPRTPYRVWISEIMLQQTQVATVIPYFERFMSSFPTLRALSEAELDDVLSHWAGLGYYRRAHHIHQSAKRMAQKHQCNFPNTRDDILSLPGVGPSTAGAILSLGFNQPSVILDGNVKRVLTRLLDYPHWPGASKHHQALWELAQTLLPDNQAAAYSQALMDLGATVCTKHEPKCHTCPIASLCKAKALATQLQRPVKKPPIKKQFIKTYVLLLQNADKHLLLEKKNNHERFPGLWHAPLTDNPKTWLQTYNITAKLTPHDPFDHHLSHIHYHFEPILITCEALPKTLPSSLTWHAPKSFAKLGMPAWMQRCINKL